MSSYLQKKPSPLRRLIVSTPATSKRLTSVSRVKQSLGITDTSQDALITELIERVSREVVAYLRIPAADDATEATLGRESYVETIRDVSGDYEVFLTRRPLSLVLYVEEDGVALEGDVDYQVNMSAGAIQRLSNDELAPWSGAKIVVTYDAGYLLPDNADRNLPYEIEEAAIYAISSRMQDLQPDGCDREVKSEAIPGVYSATYETSDARANTGNGMLPDRTRALLAAHRRPML